MLASVSSDFNNWVHTDQNVVVEGIRLPSSKIIKQMYEVESHKVIFISQKIGRIPVGTTIKGKSMFCIICCFGSYCGKKITVTLENDGKLFSYGSVMQNEARMKRTLVFFFSFSLLFFCQWRWNQLSLQIYRVKNTTDLSPSVSTLKMYNSKARVGRVCASVCKVVTGENERGPILYGNPPPATIPNHVGACHPDEGRQLIPSTFFQSFRQTGFPDSNPINWLGCFTWM